MHSAYKVHYPKKWTQLDKEAFNLEKETITRNPNKMDLKTTTQENFKGIKGETTKPCKTESKLDERPS